jgi:hypothetical protein
MAKRAPSTSTSTAPRGEARCACAIRLASVSGRWRSETVGSYTTRAGVVAIMALPFTYFRSGRCTPGPANGNLGRRRQHALLLPAVPVAPGTPDVSTAHRAAY